ncbi:unnamed protein product [Nesidiocoris tenuis]|uniref:Uncharacterized protein n=1 Tax=Nesidiocoris tenuis TaxID=355587 RepID=A0A6H5G865_9HEMI|nr:unnamed protein product [Nesidiocoris tenuis]CAA9998617.1 unnamed protein product [Nesidiocoris tenuis]
MEKNCEINLRTFEIKSKVFQGKLRVFRTGLPRKIVNQKRRSTKPISLKKMAS